MKKLIAKLLRWRIHIRAKKCCNSITKCAKNYEKMRLEIDRYNELYPYDTKPIPKPEKLWEIKGGKVYPIK